MYFYGDNFGKVSGKFFTFESSNIFIMALVKFIIRRAENPATIYARITGGYVSGELTKNGTPKKLDIVAPTKYKIDPKDWNAEKQRLKGGRNFSNKDINNELDELQLDIRKRYEKSIGSIPITSKWLKSVLIPSEGQLEHSGRITDYIDAYISEKRAERRAKGKLSDAHDKKMITLKNKLQAFEISYKEPVLLKFIDRAFIKRFTAFSNDNKYSHNTITRDVLNIKTLCIHARKNGYDTHADVVNISAGYKSAEAVYLSLDELKTLRELEGLSPRLDNARDWLLISCYSGQRVSDFLKFTSNQISTDTDYEGDTIKMITFKQVKTNKTMSIALHPIIVDILDKNGGNFPREISEQKYNKAIKDLCQEAGFTETLQGSKIVEVGKDDEGNKVFRKVSHTYQKWELVSSHIGRRSFATNHYGKMPTPYIMAITGHQTEKEFLKYIKVGSAELTKVAFKYFQ